MRGENVKTKIQISSENNVEILNRLEKINKLISELRDEIIQLDSPELVATEIELPAKSEQLDRNLASFK